MKKSESAPVELVVVLAEKSTVVESFKVIAISGKSEVLIPLSTLLVLVIILVTVITLPEAEAPYSTPDTTVLVMASANCEAISAVVDAYPIVTVPVAVPKE
jgi:hypothetical protein